MYICTHIILITGGTHCRYIPIRINCVNRDRSVKHGSTAEEYTRVLCFICYIYNIYMYLPICDRFASVDLTLGDIGMY